MVDSDDKLDFAHLSTSQTAIVVLLSIQVFLILPFLIFSIKRLLQVIDCVYFKRRGRKITIAWFGSLCAYNVILFAYMFAYLNGIESFETELTALIHHGVGSLFIWINLSRCWQLFYNNKYYEALSSKKWRSYINPSETSWFLQHRKSAGNYPIIATTCICLWLFDVFAYCSLAYVCVLSTLKLIAFFFCLKNCCCLFVYFISFSQHCKLCVLWAEFPAYTLFYILAIFILNQSKISDLFYIKQELIAFIVVMIVGSIISFILSLWAVECYDSSNEEWYCTEPSNSGDNDYDDSLDFILAYVGPGM